MMVYAGSQRNGAQPVFGVVVIFTFIFLVLGCFGAVGFAQQETNTVSTPPPLPSESNTPQVASAPAMPFMAEITGNDVYIRSGPGTNFYHCGKANRGDRVQVVKTQLGWACIVPPPSSFSWVAVQYLAVSLNDPTVAFITGNGVWVYAGSDFEEPIRSTSKQVALSRGDKVRLLGEEKDDYCKIAPPEGAYLWVSSEYIESLGPIKQLPGPGGTVVLISAEEEKLKEFEALKEKIKAEQAKPLAERNYDEIKKALTAIVQTPDAGKAAKYAELTLNQVEGFELVQKVSKEIKQQDSYLKKTTQGIDKAADARLAEIKDIGKYVVIGQFQQSSVYDSELGGVKHYRIIGQSGTTECYAVPTGSASQMDLSKFVGKKVGLVGSIKPHQPTARSIVEFNDIVEMK